MDKKLKIGVKKGGGPPPGYEWAIGLIDFVVAEGRDVLGESGYTQMRMNCQQLATADDPTHSDLVDVRPIEEFHEIRDKGAPYGGANVRVFYGVDKKERAIIPLGAIKKQNNGKTPLGDVVRMRRRWRNYLRGDYGSVDSE